MTDIRPLNAGDAPAWRALWRDYIGFYQSEVSPDVYDVTFARILSDDPENICGRVAVQNGELVGLVHYFFHPNAWKIEKVTYLQDLFVSPSQRGTGLGRKLIETVYDIADAAGCPTVYWMTQEFNTTARQLYDRVGELTPFIKYQRKIG